MQVSVEQWCTATHDGNETEFVAVQLEHFGFTLSRLQVAEFCRKLERLQSGEACHTDDGDALFLDLDCTTSESPFVVLALASDNSHVRWFCDIPMSAAMEMQEKLWKRLGDCCSEMSDTVN